jgi:hypothetical protein
MYKRKKFSLFDTGAEGDPKRVFLDVLFVITGPLIIVPYSKTLGVIWTVLAVAFLVLDAVQFLRKKRKKQEERAEAERKKALQAGQAEEQEKKD